MANSDVRAAMATLDTAIQAIDVSALEAATFTPGEHTSYAAGLRFHLIATVRDAQRLSTEAVAQFQALTKLED
jgi:hypothetical protein